MRCKFDLCYLMAKEGSVFEKYSSFALYGLETCHGIVLGPEYKVAPSTALFTHYIAESQRTVYYIFVYYI